MVEQVRADEEAVLVALQLEAAPVDHQLRALRDAAIRPAPGCRSLRRRGDHRAEIHIVSGGIGADLQLLDPRDQPLDQRVGRRLAHRHRDRDRHAAFARRAIARAHQRIRRLVQVGVRHDDHVVLGAAEALHALAVRAAAAIDVFARSGSSRRSRWPGWSGCRGWRRPLPCRRSPPAARRRAGPPPASVRPASAAPRGRARTASG